MPVHCTSRLHSSMAQVRPELQEAFTESPLEERRKHSVAFSLQWSDVPSPSLMINPLRQTRIEGEANIIRYLTRLLPATSPYNYEATGTYSTIAETDHLLDTLERGLVWGAGKERAVVMREVVKRLTRSPYLCGGQCGAADLLAWSLLRHRGGAQEEAVGRWFAQVDAMTGIDLSKVTPKQQQQQNKKKAPPPSQPPPTTTTTAAATTAGERGSGNSHLGRKNLEHYLKKLAVPYQVKEHKEVFTVDELMTQVRGLPGIVTKNLFLRDKKKVLYILSTKHDTEIDLKTLAKKINTKRPAFRRQHRPLRDLRGETGLCVPPGPHQRPWPPRPGCAGVVSHGPVGGVCLLPPAEQRCHFGT
ncbi:hypothetical protein O3P69_019201 [Scylla paramamosain]|uniref:PrdX deacylase domain-containing protein 1 n=1 Tax=Scylla paramamosain TaxID=85552 RepID=A0AAW0SVT8_SCYPA